MILVTVAQSFFNIAPFYINTLSPAFVEHRDPLFVEVGVLDLQKGVCSSSGLIIVKMVTNVLLLHLGEEVVVLGYPIGGRCYDEFNLHSWITALR